MRAQSRRWPKLIDHIPPVAGRFHRIDESASLATFDAFQVKRRAASRCKAFVYLKSPIKSTEDPVLVQQYLYGLRERRRVQASIRVSHWQDKIKYEATSTEYKASLRLRSRHLFSGTGHQQALQRILSKAPS